MNNWFFLCVRRKWPNVRRVSKCVTCVPSVYGVCKWAYVIRSQRGLVDVYLTFLMVEHPKWESAWLQDSLRFVGGGRKKRAVGVRQWNTSRSEGAVQPSRRTMNKRKANEKPKEREEKGQWRMQGQWEKKRKGDEAEEQKKEEKEEEEEEEEEEKEEECLAAESKGIKEPRKRVETKKNEKRRRRRRKEGRRRRRRRWWWKRRTRWKVDCNWFRLTDASVGHHHVSRCRARNVYLPFNDVPTHRTHRTHLTHLAHSPRLPTI